MSVLPRPYMRRILSHLGNPICTAIVHTPPKIPGRARNRYDRTGPPGPATVPPLSAVRPNSREEGSGARTPRATGAPQYMTSHPASDLPASKAHARDRPASYPGATGHRPPVDPRRHRAQGSPQRPRRRIRFCRREDVAGTHIHTLICISRAAETIGHSASSPASRRSADSALELANCACSRGYLADGKPCPGCVPAVALAIARAFA